MLKKIVLILVLFFSFINFGFSASGDKDAKISQEKIDKQVRDENCELTGGCIDKTSFIISVDDISPGMSVHKGTTTENVNFALGTIIQTLMIALGSLAMIIMTVGAGYIILHNGDDALLSKGKAIFMSGVYALVIALSSYYLISMVRFILYNSTN